MNSCCPLHAALSFPHPLQVVAERLSEEEILDIMEIFQQLDTDKSGSISLEEMRTGLKRMGSVVEDTELEQLYSAVS